MELEWGMKTRCTSNVTRLEKRLNSNLTAGGGALRASLARQSETHPLGAVYSREYEQCPVFLSGDCACVSVAPANAAPAICAYFVVQWFEPISRHERYSCHEPQCSRARVWFELLFMRLRIFSHFCFAAPASLADNDLIHITGEAIISLPNDGHRPAPRPRIYRYAMHGYGK
jgi:hypothetical protein